MNDAPKKKKRLKALRCPLMLPYQVVKQNIPRRETLTCLPPPPYATSKNEKNPSTYATCSPKYSPRPHVSSHPVVFPREYTGSDMSNSTTAMVPSPPHYPARIVLGPPRPWRIKTPPQDTSAISPPESAPRTAPRHRRAR